MMYIIFHYLEEVLASKILTVQSMDFFETIGTSFLIFLFLIAAQIFLHYRKMGDDLNGC